MPIVTQLKSIDIARVFAAMEREKYALWLDGQAGEGCSFVCCNPDNLIRLNKPDGNAFEKLKAALGEKRQTIEGLAPFQGGAAGLFSYDLVRGIEALPVIAKDNGRTPAIAVGIYNQVLSTDHKTGKSFLITHGNDDKHEEFLRKFVENPPELPKPPPKISLKPTVSQREYEEKVKRIIKYILDGDVFQANLSQKFFGGFEGSPFEHYLALRARNPAPFSGYFSIDNNCKIACASPERFLRVQNGAVTTCPIKGTQPISAPENELLSSAKDRAENIMIVDLLRDNLSKVCAPKSVKVKSLCELRAFEKVRHLVSTITGTLEGDFDAIDLLKACWAGGSITGAPKIRAMEIIEELEEERRGAYCGSLGYIGFDGQMDTNILIRTLVFSKNEVSLRVGGGIVLDSDPRKEYEETLSKANGMV